MSGPRINIDYAGAYAEKPWRFIIRDHAFESGAQGATILYKKYGNLTRSMDNIEAVSSMTFSLTVGYFTHFP